MALIKCKECGAKISTKAKACPSCGAEAPKKTSGCAWIVLIFIAIPTLLSIFYAGITGPAQKAEQASKEAARVAALTPEQIAAEQKAARIKSALGACRIFSKNALKDPDTGEFIGYSPAEPNADASKVTMQVTWRATNSFGARLPTILECSVVMEGDKWRLINMEIIR